MTEHKQDRPPIKTGKIRVLPGVKDGIIPGNDLIANQILRVVEAGMIPAYVYPARDDFGIEEVATRADSISKIISSKSPNSNIKYEVFQNGLDITSIYYRGNQLPNSNSLISTQLSDPTISLSAKIELEKEKQNNDSDLWEDIK